MSSRIVQKPGKFPISKGAAAEFGGFSLTTNPDRGKMQVTGITKYADVVELVDSLDLGAVTSVKVFGTH